MIGLSSANSVAAVVGSTTLLSGAPKTAVGTYQLVPVGTDPVILTVDGTSEPVPDKTLAAGHRCPLGGAFSYDTSVASTSTGTVTATDYSTSATLASGAVYSMFMFGSAASPIGELSKER